MRKFTDPFTGETLDNPTRKSYKVVYSINGRSDETYINTLAKNRLSKKQAKEKLMKRPGFMMNSISELSIEAISKVEEVDRGGSEKFPWEP